MTGLSLTVDEMEAEDRSALKEWLKLVAEAACARILDSDDTDALKAVADELEQEHQVFMRHVKHNTETSFENLEPKVESDENGSEAEIGVAPEQPLKDLKRLGIQIFSWRPEEEKELEET